MKNNAIIIKQQYKNKLCVLHTYNCKSTFATPFTHVTYHSPLVLINVLSLQVCKPYFQLGIFAFPT